jgi:hypothetical protein
MAWRVARSLEQLREALNAQYPGRSTLSDGSIGDAAHASRTSDHNPWVIDSSGVGVVTARDFTHDPAHGFDAHAFAERLRLSRDPRIKYIISNARICSATISPWQWRKFSGVNPHDKHVHVSVVSDRRYDDDGSPWTAVPPSGSGESEDDMPSNDEIRRLVVEALAETKVDEDVSEIRRLVGVLTGWRAPAAGTPERSIGQQVAAITGTKIDVDEVALAKSLAPLLTPAIAAALKDAASLSEEEAEAAAERAMRNVMGSVAEPSSPPSAARA